MMTCCSQIRFTFKVVCALVVGLFLSSCSLNSSWNDKRIEPEISKASVVVNDRGKHEKTLFVLASSGGGSRAAYLTGSAMLKLQSIATDKSNLLEEIDAMSPVSGSALPTAYYAISKDPNSTECENSHSPGKGRLYPRPVWDDKTVKKLMSKNYQRNWFFRWFLPQNIVRFWFTSFDRSDIMSQVYANVLFDRKWAPGAYTFGEICSNRPNLIVNSTIGSSGGFGERFVFTEESMNATQSSINSYEIARGVMSSSAFPVAFNFTSLRDFSKQDTTYIHLFDGGNYDNLGITTALNVIARNKQEYDRIVLLLVDAYTTPVGASPEKSDPRSVFDFIADTNFLDSVSVMMGKNRRDLVKAAHDTVSSLNNVDEKPAIFCHFRFSSLKDETLVKGLNAIDTAFSITKPNTELLDRAIAGYFSDDVVQDILYGVTGEGQPSGVCKRGIEDFLNI